MNLAERIVAQWTIVRDMSENLLADFETPEQWTRQLAPGTNHALWFAGHMSMADNSIIGMIDADRTKPMEEWNSAFNMGSQPTNNPDDYPPPAEVLDQMRERRGVLLELLLGLSDEQLTAPSNAFESMGQKDLGGLLEMMVWHEALHAGQISSIRRSLGHDPIFQPQSAESSAS